MPHPPAQRLRRLLQHALAPAVVPRPEAEWASDLQLARSHEVHLFLYDALQREHAPVEPAAMSALRTAFLEGLQAAERRRAQAGELLAALAGRGVDVMPLKGLWLAEWVYPQYALRPMHDLDILVRPAQRADAGAALEQAGYTAYGRDTGTHQVYLHAHWDFPVELHVRVKNETACGPDAEGVWARSEPGAVAGQPCRLPALDDQLLLLSGHLLNHELGYFPLRALLDLALVMRKAGPALDLFRVLSQARELRMVKGAGLVLEMAGSLASLEQEVTFPPDFRPPPALVEEAWDVVLDHGAFRLLPPETVDQLAQATGWSDRLRLLAGRLFLPPEELRTFYPWADGRFMRPLALAARGIELARLYGGMLWSLARRDPRMAEALDIKARRRRLVGRLMPD